LWVVLTSAVSAAQSDALSGAEAEQYELAYKLVNQGRRGEAVRMLGGLKSPLARAGLALIIAKDDVTARLLGVTSFDPDLGTAKK
jgi:hypothetical protein